jgi:hypothetical protein
VSHSRRAPPGVPVDRPTSLGTQTGTIPAWVFVLLVVLPVATGWVVAGSVDFDLSWARGSVGARSGTSRGPGASDPGAGVPTVAALEANSRPGVADAPSLTGPEPRLAGADVPGPRPGQAARVAHTDGQGVVLRTAPREDARVPRGLLEGARVTVLEQPDGEWAHVRGDNGLEGWVPIEFLAAPD